MNYTRMGGLATGDLQNISCANDNFNTDVNVEASSSTYEDLYKTIFKTIGAHFLYTATLCCTGCCRESTQKQNLGDKEKKRSSSYKRIFHFVGWMVLGAAIRRGVSKPLTDSIVHMNEDMELKSVSWMLLAGLVYYTVGYAPFKEEEIFRGKLQPALNDRAERIFSFCRLKKKVIFVLSRVVSVTQTSLIFGLAHIVNAIFMRSFANTSYQCVHAAILGIFLGAVKEVTGKLAPPTGMHLGANLDASLVLISRTNINWPPFF